MDSNKIGSCIIGEKLRGFARKIKKFPNKSPIFRINKQGIKLDSHGGAMSECYVDRKIRSSIQSDETNEPYKEAIRVHITQRYQEKISIFGNRADFIKGSDIICECEGGNISDKKVSAYSSSHSCSTGIFEGRCALAYVDKAFSPTGTYSLAN